jgi:hypothetical protein
MHQTQGHPYTFKKKERNLMALRAQADPNTVIMRDLNTPLTPVDRSFRKKNQQRNFRDTPHLRPNRHG